MNIKMYVKDWCSKCTMVENGACGALRGKDDVPNPIDKITIGVCLDRNLFTGVSAE